MLAGRLERAMALVGGVSSQGEGVWVVEGSNVDYIVWADPVTRSSTCTCADFLQRGAKCKHILAVALVFVTEKV